MRDRIAKDRLIVKLFYTACCVWVGFGLVPLLLLIHDPDKGNLDARGTATVYGFIFTVLLPIWVPPVRRQYSGLPHDVFEVPRIIWAFLAPFAATMILWFSLMLPLAFLFSSTDNTRLLAALVALVGVALIVLLSWDVAADRDLVRDRTFDQ